MIVIGKAKTRTPHAIANVATSLPAEAKQTLGVYRKERRKKKKQVSTFDYHILKHLIFIFQSHLILNLFR